MLKNIGGSVRCVGCYSDALTYDAAALPVTHTYEDYAVSIWPTYDGAAVVIGRCDGGHSIELEPESIMCVPFLAALHESIVYATSGEGADHVSQIIPDRVGEAALALV